MGLPKCRQMTDPERDEYVGHWNSTRKIWEPEIDGERHVLSVWERIYGNSVALMMMRHHRLGWDWELAIMIPAKKYGNNQERRRAAGMPLAACHELASQEPER